MDIGGRGKNLRDDGDRSNDSKIGGGGINNGSRQSELEKMMPISVHDASFSTVLEGFWS